MTLVNGLAPQSKSVAAEAVPLPPPPIILSSLGVYSRNNKIDFYATLIENYSLSTMG